MSLHPCPQCESKIDIAATAVVSEIVECADCRAELEVMATNPVMLAVAPEVGEDWGE